MVAKRGSYETIFLWKVEQNTWLAKSAVKNIEIKVQNWEKYKCE